MEITSFVLGMLMVVAVIMVAVIVVGIVKIYKQKEEVNGLHITISNMERDIFNRIDRVETQLYHESDELRREYSSYVDSRIDKLQSKTEKGVLKG
jgi:hypothetical protein